ncbi:hypothetical protein RJT34_19904 [Clitoria ternatea]|uniref:Uncharacterized protein n=1 Tax=Clitoria ternatea TaxID=43366 RepID=A0AAN9ISC1_CLITE
MARGPCFLFPIFLPSPYPSSPNSDFPHFPAIFSNSRFFDLHNPSPFNSHLGFRFIFSNFQSFRLVLKDGDYCLVFYL